MHEYCTLNKLQPGTRGTVCSMDTGGSMHRRLLDIGLTVGTEVKCLGRSPAGDPSAFLIRGAVIALRAEDSGKIRIQRIIRENGTD